jgi:branched-chain amino acid transport system ATP-binding protein
MNSAEPTSALEISSLKKSFGGVLATQDVSLTIRPGERRLIIGAERRRQDDSVQPDHR